MTSIERDLPRLSGRIRIAESDRIETFPVGVQAVLFALGHPEALVTDRSSVGDFVTEEIETKGGEPEHPKMKDLRVLMGRDIRLSELIADLAREIEHETQTGLPSHDGPASSTQRI